MPARLCAVPRDRQESLFIDSSGSDEDRKILRGRIGHLYRLAERDRIKIYSRPDLPPGEPMRERLQHYMESADYYVPLISIDFLTAPDSSARFRAAERRSISGDGLVIVAAMLRPCKLDLSPGSTVIVFPRKLYLGKRESLWIELAAQMEDLIQNTDNYTKIACKRAETVEASYLEEAQDGEAPGAEKQAASPTKGSW